VPTSADNTLPEILSIDAWAEWRGRSDYRRNRGRKSDRCTSCYTSSEQRLSRNSAASDR